LTLPQFLAPWYSSTVENPSTSLPWKTAPCKSLSPLFNASECAKMGLGIVETRRPRLWSRQGTWSLLCECVAL
jgi:hypothetical protein